MNEKKIGCITGVLAFVLCAVILLLSCIGSFNGTEYTLTVTDKERASDSSQYLVFAEDKNGESYVFKNTDKMLRGKFDSSNVQGKIKVDHTYRFTVIGFRIPLFST